MDKEEIRRKLHAYKPLVIENETFAPAAVLMALFQKDGEWNVLLTLRPHDIATHQNQICFPGGSLDEGERLLDCALRETEEEMGIRRDDVEILGRLDDILTITNYRITPFVGVIPYPYEFRVSEREIAEVIEAPLRIFMDPGKFRREDKWEFEGKSFPVYFFDVGKHVVWGATAKMIKQFLETVMGWSEPTVGRV